MIHPLPSRGGVVAFPSAHPTGYLTCLIVCCPIRTGSKALNTVADIIVGVQLIHFNPL